MADQSTTQAGQDVASGTPDLVTELYDIAAGLRTLAAMLEQAGQGGAAYLAGLLAERTGAIAGEMDG